MPSQGIDFEYCAVMHEEVKSFTLVNPSNVTVTFDVSMDETDICPFLMEPKTGKLHIFNLNFIFKFRHLEAWLKVGDYH